MDRKSLRLSPLFEMTYLPLICDFLRRLVCEFGIVVRSERPFIVTINGLVGRHALSRENVLNASQRAECAIGVLAAQTMDLDRPDCLRRPLFRGLFKLVGQAKTKRPEHAAEAVEDRGLRLQSAIVFILRSALPAANYASLHSSQ